VSATQASTHHHHFAASTHPTPLTQSHPHHAQARSAKARQQADAAAKAALAEDPSIYDYDGVYDAMQAERGERARQAAEAAQEEKKGSKYIESLKRVRARLRAGVFVRAGGGWASYTCVCGGPPDGRHHLTWTTTAPSMQAAELKKREQDRYFERRLAKERKVRGWEDGMQWWINDRFPLSVSLTVFPTRTKPWTHTHTRTHRTRTSCTRTRRCSSRAPTRRSSWR
jgi:hypothetical protein